MFKKSTTIRDMSFYIISIGVLALFTYLGAFTVVSGLILLSIYVAYIVVLYFQTKKYQNDLNGDEHDDEDDEDMSIPQILFWMLVTISAVWVSIDAIIQSAITVAAALNIPTYIVSVIIIAACTSIPDTLLSVKSARKRRC